MCRLFLLGLAKFGKGDWRSISRNFVISRTPTQVASHAQKYFIRLNSINKDKRRSSIHDITSVAGASGDPNAHAAGPITGQPANVVPGSMAHAQGVPAPVVAAPPQVAPGTVVFAAPAQHGPMGHLHHHPLLTLPAAPGHPAAFCPAPPHHLVRPMMTAHGVPMAPMGYVPAKWE